MTSGDNARSFKEAPALEPFDASQVKKLIGKDSIVD